MAFEGGMLGQPQLFETLANIGLTYTDSRVYIFLAKTGPQKAKGIGKNLNISKQRLYPCLKNLQKKELVYATLEFPATFYALSLEKVLELYARLKVNEAENARKNKAELLKLWQSLISDSDTTT